MSPWGNIFGSCLSIFMGASFEQWASQSNICRFMCGFVWLFPVYSYLWTIEQSNVEMILKIRDAFHYNT